MRPLLIGLDIGGTKCAVLLAEVNQGIRILDKIRFPTCAEKGFRYTYDNLCLSVDRIVERGGVCLSDICAIGISCGGPLDSKTGTILCPPNLPGWVNVPITSMLEKRFGRPAFLQNDANACALVEWKLGAGRGTRDMIFLTMGTGMGGGIIADGRLLRGQSDMAGEIGHLRLTEDGPVGFGKAGSFEGYASGGGIQRQAEAFTQSLLSQGKTPAWYDVCRAQKHALDAKLMADYARNGDPDARRFFEQIGKMLGRGVALLVDMLNPERIVIGSIFARCEDLLRAPMEEALHKEALSFSLRGLTIVPAETGERIGDLASIMVAVDALGMDPQTAGEEDPPKVKAIFERLFTRFPALEACKDQVTAAYCLMKDCYLHQGKIMVLGNGGSCADSEHIVGELMKGFYLKRPLKGPVKQAIHKEMQPYFEHLEERLQGALPAIALTGHAALSTAAANDQDPLLPAAQQIVGYGRPGDLVIGISTSGHSANVLAALATARGLGLKTLGLTGRSGGSLKALCDAVITVPADTPADVQEYHLPVYHTLCAMLEEAFFGEDA